MNAMVNAEDRRAARRAYYAANKKRENAMARARHIKNRDKNLAKQRLWAAARPGYWRAQRGLPHPTRAEPDVCEICGKLPRHFKSLCLDHCHVSNQFRGWLCTSCNKSIGTLGDDIKGLMNAVRYLERAAKQQET
jgi:hypothetical protein